MTCTVTAMYYLVKMTWPLKMLSVKIPSLWSPFAYLANHKQDSCYCLLKAGGYITRWLV